jgi:hypothetical protein
VVWRWATLLAAQGSCVAQQGAAGGGQTLLKVAFLTKWSRHISATAVMLMQCPALPRVAVDPWCSDMLCSVQVLVHGVGAVAAASHALLSHVRSLRPLHM